MEEGGRRRLDRSPLEEHLDRLRATAYKLTGSATESQDLLQDCIVTALCGIDRLRQPELLGAWLQQILRTKWYDRLRRKQIERRVLQNPQCVPPARPKPRLDGPAHDHFEVAEPWPLRRGEGPEDAGENLDAARVARALASLSPQDREILELKFFQSKNSTEIAACLGCPAGTARSRVFHALRRFEGRYRDAGRGGDSS